MKMKTPPLNSRRCLTGFTLIEIMIVISIAAMVMAMGIPAIFSALKKDALRQAVSDVVEACSEARAHAILSGYPTEVVFEPLDYTFHVGVAAVESSGSSSPGGEGISMTATDGGHSTMRPPSFSRQLSDQLVIEMLSVNFVEFKEEEMARVRFYPNGTCDEFTIVLQWPQTRAYRKISLDIITSLADVEVIR